MSHTHTATNRTRVALLYGGASPEHHISCISAAHVLSYPAASKYQIYPIGITEENRWYLQPEQPALSEFTKPQSTQSQKLAIVQDHTKELCIRPGVGFEIQGNPLPIDVAVIMVHGTHGEDGVLQGALTTAGIPYTGANLLASALGMNKVIAKVIWQQQGLPVTPYTTLTAQQWHKHSIQALELQSMLELLPNALFVKPAEGGSSLGITKCTTKEQVAKGIEIALQYGNQVLIEQGLRVREIEFAVLGDRVFHPGEIESAQGFYDFTTKYETDIGDSLHTHAKLPAQLLASMRNLASKAYHALGVESFARVDLFLTPDNRVYINEINTIPGMTGISMFPSTILAAGVSKEELFDQWITQAIERGTL